MRQSGVPDEISLPRSVIVRRGEIWLAALDPIIGGEIQKTRRCVVVSPPELHDFLHVVTVAPMTTGSRAAPYQLRTLDKRRLVRRLDVITDNTLRLTFAALREMLEE